MKSILKSSNLLYGEGIANYINAKQKHLGCKKGETNQKQQLSNYMGT